MERSAFEEMLSTQETHWWFRGKRKIIQTLIERLCVNEIEKLQILEIGCGTGANLEMLSHYGKVTALEVDDYARRHIRPFEGVEALPGWLPDGLNTIQGKSFDLVCLFDVLEHIADDKEALVVLKQFLKPTARLLVTVPAYQWLFSVHDKKLGHYRRYDKRQLSRILDSAGYKLLFLGYMNMCLLPVMAISRLLDKLRDASDSSGTKTPAQPINTILYSLFALETLWLPYFSTPFGGSVIALAGKVR